MSAKPQKSKPSCKERTQYQETLAKIKEASPARPIGRPKNWSDEDQLAWLSIFSTETASDRLNEKKRWKIFSERLLEEWELEKSSEDCKNQVSNCGKDIFSSVCKISCSGVGGGVLFIFCNKYYFVIQHLLSADTLQKTIEVPY